MGLIEWFKKTSTFNTSNVILIPSPETPNHDRLYLFSLFSITYEGPSLESGTMDVKIFAPALLDIGQLFEAANEEINGARAKIKVNVAATKIGFFEVDISLIQGIYARARSFLVGDPVIAVLSLAGLIGIGKTTGY